MNEVIAIDGPSCSGKGTVAKLVAESLNFYHLESGLIYRNIAASLYDSLGQESEIIDLAIDAFQSLDLNSICLIENGKMRKHKNAYTSFNAQLTSKISQFQSIRNEVLNFQRALLNKTSIVAEGRDMASIVFPNAKLKVYLDCPAEIRAQRRYKQLKLLEKDVSLAQVLDDILNRDERDTKRLNAPLVITKESKVFDTSKLSVEETVSGIISAFASN